MKKINGKLITGQGSYKHKVRNFFTKMGNKLIKIVINLNLHKTEIKNSFIIMRVFNTFNLLLTLLTSGAFGLSAFYFIVDLFTYMTLPELLRQAYTKEGSVLFQMIYTLVTKAYTGFCDLLKLPEQVIDNSLKAQKMNELIEASLNGYDEETAKKVAADICKKYELLQLEVDKMDELLEASLNGYDEETAKKVAADICQKYEVILEDIKKK